MASVYERITNALSALGKRRERDNGSQEAGRGGAGGSERERKRVFRPWEQTDLHRRLETYKPLTWFAKPDSVGAVPCALRGWINDACDSLTCEHCGAKLVYPPRVAYDQSQAAADKFAPFLTSKHQSSCPWRQTQCEPTLLAYQPASTNDELCNLFQSLQNKLLRVDVLPDLDAIAIQTVRNASRPFGSYEDIVLGSGAVGPGAITPHRKAPRVRITTVGEDDPDGLQRSPSSSSAGGAGGPLDPSTSETYIIQPSKLTPQQKARLLALLGWDVEVLQPDTATGSAAAPYAQSTGYSLSHLGVKPKKPLTAGGKPPSAAKAASGGDRSMTAGGGDCDRYPMAQVVLKCPRCNNRMGLWNFAGVRPVPSGRLTPGQPSAGAAALLSPRVSAGGAAGATTAITTAGTTPSDPLSATIAGGQYGLHGFGGAAAPPKPFGSGAGAPTPTPAFRFGSGSSSAPVFGVAALDADAVQRAVANTSAGGFGFGSPLGSPAPKLLLTGPAATPVASMAAPGAATPVAAQPPPSAAVRGAPLTGQKRKVSEPGLAPEGMDVDPAMLSGAGAITPGPATARGSFGGGVNDAKRQRVASDSSAATPAAPGASPHVGRSSVPDVQQLRELDPVNQHRSWCPWVYTGAPGQQQHMSGWQHMLSALAAQQQQQVKQQQDTMAAATLPPAGTAVATTPSVDAKQLRDNALGTLRSL